MNTKDLVSWEITVHSVVEVCRESSMTLDIVSDFTLGRSVAPELCTVYVIRPSDFKVFGKQGVFFFIISVEAS